MSPQQRWQRKQQGVSLYLAAGITAVSMAVPEKSLCRLRLSPCIRECDQAAGLRAMNKKAETADFVTSKPDPPKTAKVILNDTDALVVTGTPLSDSEAGRAENDAAICAGRTARSLRSTGVRQAMRRACASLGGRAFETAQRAWQWSPTQRCSWRVLLTGMECGVCLES
jgi:hypothetical protein